jgi:hypothetical protein
VFNAEDQAGGVARRATGSELEGGGLDTNIHGGIVGLLGLPAPGAEGVVGEETVDEPSRDSPGGGDPCLEPGGDGD